MNRIKSELINFELHIKNENIKNEPLKNELIKKELIRTTTLDLAVYWSADKYASPVLVNLLMVLLCVKLLHKKWGQRDRVQYGDEIRYNIFW